MPRRAPQERHTVRSVWPYRTMARVDAGRPYPFGRGAQTPQRMFGLRVHGFPRQPCSACEHRFMDLAAAWANAREAGLVNQDRQPPAGVGKFPAVIRNLLTSPRRRGPCDRDREPSTREPVVGVEVAGEGRCESLENETMWQDVSELLSPPDNARWVFLVSLTRLPPATPGMRARDRYPRCADARGGLRRTGGADRGNRGLSVGPAWTSRGSPPEYVGAEPAVGGRR